MQKLIIVLQLWWGKERRRYDDLQMTHDLKVITAVRVWWWVFPVVTPKIDVALKIALKWFRVRRKTSEHWMSQSCRCHVQFRLETICHSRHATVVETVLASYDYRATDVQLCWRFKIWTSLKTPRKRQMIQTYIKVTVTASLFL